MNTSNPKRSLSWPALIPLALGIAVGSGILRQPGWESRALQILAAAVVAGSVAAVGILVLHLLRGRNR